MINNPYQAYNNASVLTASPGELTLMLYNGAIRFAKQAKMAMEQHNIPETNQYIQKAQSIVFEFMATLNMEYEVSANMMALYRFINEHLLKANIRKDANLLQEAIELLETMRDTWNEALKLTRTQKAAGSN